ncbi:MAG: UDP-N-acetylmuramyl-tripeptide synthetase [Clostridia bacterium]|nr:UDP-N-acetylmuramyl-tripeptide synthetase [Clostridia bacterium]
MTLFELKNALDILKDHANENCSIESIQYHSKKVKPNSLFVCVRGYKVDGHQYLQAAKDAGAVVAVVEEFQAVDIPQIQVSNSRIALASLGDAFYNHPSQKLKLIGITATNGKTTTSFMMDSILEAHHLSTGLIGTVVVKIKDQQEAAELTTPESLDLQRYFSEMVAAGVTHTTMEVSSSALETHRTYGSDFDIVALNNISREHIDSHGTFEAYYDFKAGLIRNAKPDAVAVLNLDDPYSKQLIQETQAKVLTYGVNDPSGHVFITDLDLSTGRGKFIVHLRDLPYEEKSFEVVLSIPGYHCVYNSLAAITIALSMNIPIEAIQRGLTGFTGIERRFECIFEEDYKIYDDHFANAGNIQVTLETLNFMHYNQLHLVYAIRGSRGVTVNKENAETIVKWAEKLNLTEIIATKSKSHVIWKDEVTDDEEAIFLKIMAEAKIKVHLYDELPDAIHHALDKVQPKDVILLAGCQGMDYGCNIIINQLEIRRPELNKEALRKPLKTRVAGLLEG